MEINQLDGKQPVPLFTEKEAAEMLRISEHTLKRIRYAGDIEFYRISNRVFYTQELLDQFISRCRQGGGWVWQ